MIGLDTNVLVRYIMQDDPKQSPKAVRSIESLESENPGPASSEIVIPAERVSPAASSRQPRSPARGGPPGTIECTWRASRFDPTAMQSFATLHPKAALWLVAEDRQSWITRRHGAIEVVECGPTHLPELMGRHRRR